MGTLDKNIKTKSASVNPKLDAALTAIARREPVFPTHWTNEAGRCSCGDAECKRAGKHPLTPNGFHDATLNEARVIAWWTQWPNANPATSPGDSNLVYFDCDVKRGIDGIQSLADYLGISRGDVFKLSRAIETWSGGLHVPFFTDNVFVSTTAVLPGVDIRSHGGYVLAPGAVIAGKAYRVVSDVQPAPLPDKLKALLRAPRARDPRSQEPLFELDLNACVDRARDFLKTRDPAIEGRGGDSHTYATACQLKDLGISEQTSLDLMLEDGGWNDWCEPSWDAKELAVKVANAWRYGANRPGSKGGGLMEMMDAVGEDASAVLKTESEFPENPSEAELKRAKLAEMMKAFSTFRVQASSVVASDIPLRRNFIGKSHIPGFVSMTAGPGGGAKTRLNHAREVGLASGKPLTGETLHEGPKKVLAINFEEPIDELRRRYLAIAQYHKIAMPENLTFLASTSLPFDLSLASDANSGVSIHDGVIEWLDSIIVQYGYDVLCLDPFVDTHSVDENSNMKMKKVMSLLTRLAARRAIAIHLTHHTSQAAAKNKTTDASASRGATSIPAAARHLETLHTEGDTVGRDMIAAHGPRLSAMLNAKPEPWRLKYLTVGKVNMSEQSEARQYFALASVDLENGRDLHRGDGVGVLVPFSTGLTSGQASLTPESMVAAIIRKLRDRRLAAGRISLGLHQECVWLREQGLTNHETTAHRAIQKFLGSRAEIVEGAEVRLGKEDGALMLVVNFPPDRGDEEG